MSRLRSSSASGGGSGGAALAARHPSATARAPSAGPRARTSSALPPRRDAIELTDDLEVLEQVEVLHHGRLADEVEVPPDQGLLQGGHVARLRALPDAVDGEEEQGGGEPGREGHEGHAPAAPQRASVAPRL